MLSPSGSVPIQMLCEVEAKNAILFQAWGLGCKQTNRHFSPSFSVSAILRDKKVAATVKWAW